MVGLAAIFASLAAITGILAIGSGQHWKFTVADYFRGKRNAILYLWVIISTIYSILHAGVLTNYGLDHGFSARDSETTMWMFFHAGMGFLLTGAHAYIVSTLSKEVGPVDKYLWGKNRAV